MGGREEIIRQSLTAKKKRGRPSSNTPTRASKAPRNGKPHPLDTSPPRTVKDSWSPPKGSWEDEIVQIDACQDEDSKDLIIYLTWKGGQKTQHPTKQVYAKCPQKVSRFQTNFKLLKN
jgi:chromobox protein 1